MFYSASMSCDLWRLVSNDSKSSRCINCHCMLYMITVASSLHAGNLWSSKAIGPHSQLLSASTEPISRVVPDAAMTAEIGWQVVEAAPFLFHQPLHLAEDHTKERIPWPTESKYCITTNGSSSLIPTLLAGTLQLNSSRFT